MKVVYGVGCTWWDTIDKVGNRGSLPCCPHCNSVLYEMESEEEWWKQAKEYEKNAKLTDYVDMMTWARGRCFMNFTMLKAAYLETKLLGDQNYVFVFFRNGSYSIILVVRGQEAADHVTRWAADLSVYRIDAKDGKTLFKRERQNHGH